MGKKHTLFRKTCLLFSVFIILVLRSYCGATHRKLQVSIEPRNTTVHIENVVPAIELHRGNVALPDIASHVLAAERAGRGKKIISMSLYGNDARYTLGAIINAMLTQRDWPGWTLRMYVGDGVPNDVVALLHFFGVELVKITSNQKGIAGMFWRFYALEDRTATRVIVRDADARLTKRDRSAVEEWIESGRYFHVLNDHPFHSVPIMGGMWGAVNGFVNPHVLQEWRNQDNKTGQHYSKGTDQAWLASVVWPAVKTHTLQHASHFCGAFGAAEWRGFPTPRESPCDFVGNVFWDENGWEGDKVADPVCDAKCLRNPSSKHC